MCTALSYRNGDFYFGRTFDYEISYGEQVVVVPRRFEIDFSEQGKMNEHYAVIGMAHVRNGYPLFYDAINEKGVAVAGLNFVGNACYGKSTESKVNVAQYEFILWILAQCESVYEIQKLTENLNITDRRFEKDMPIGQLHWMIADKNKAITLEATSDGIHVYDNQPGVLTNNPPFDIQLAGLNNYMNLSAKEAENTFSKKLPLKRYSRGMGAIGLPGDWSSASRFVRTVFVKENSVSEKNEIQNVNQFFHILGSAEQVRGCCETENGMYEKTIYTSCCNADKGIYYYKTYENYRINAIDMYRENIDGNLLRCYPLEQNGEINFVN